MQSRWLRSGQPRLTPHGYGGQALIDETTAIVKTLATGHIFLIWATALRQTQILKTYS